jgi:hypothetical protein
MQFKANSEEDTPSKLMNNPDVFEEEQIAELEVWIFSPQYHFHNIIARSVMIGEAHGKFAKKWG